MSGRNELAAFDDELVAETATDHDLAESKLADLARTHQARVRDLPGVDDIVYEWRNHFHLDPLLARTEDAYYLALPTHVWTEFGDDLGSDDAERAALLDLHDRQARRVASTVGINTVRLDEDHAVVLTRP